MFEDYSTRAKHVILLARHNAGQRGAGAIELEDMAIALIVEDQGGIRKALSDRPTFPNTAAQADLRLHPPFLPPGLADDLLVRVQALCPLSQAVSSASDLPVSERTHQAFAASCALRDKLQQSKVEPLHLLAAIAEDESSGVAQILREAGITHENIVKAVREEATTVPQLRPVREGTGLGPGPAAWSERAGAVNFLARLTARTRGSRIIEIEDLLVSLLIEDQGGFMDAISTVPGVGIDIARMPQPHQAFLPREIAADLLVRVKALCRRSQPLPSESDILTCEGVKRAFAVADLLRKALKQELIDPLHLLAAVVGTEPGITTQMFVDIGINSDEILRVLRGE